MNDVITAINILQQIKSTDDEKKIALATSEGIFEISVKKRNPCTIGNSAENIIFDEQIFEGG